MAPSAADICVKPGYPNVTNREYKLCVSKFKKTGLRQQHPDHFPGPVALEVEEKTLGFEVWI